MEFEEALMRLTEGIVRRVCDVYHMTDADAERLMKRSIFYQVLSDPNRGFWRKDAETCFRLLQNEIEYGSWDRNESGGIAE